MLPNIFLKAQNLEDLWHKNKLISKKVNVNKKNLNI